jgi:predicted metal-dependent HD superfamily phosphohydrolase
MHTTSPPTRAAGSADSEQLSADLAKQLLTQAGSSQQVVDAVVGHIMSTQGHRHLPGDTDNALFLDADLSILATGFNR